MKNVVISVGNILLSDSIMNSLRVNSEIMAERIGIDKIKETVKICKGISADILLMEVSMLPQLVLNERMEIVEKMRKEVPDCRLVLLCDEVANPEIANEVMEASKYKKIDDFLFASISSSYLVAKLEAV